MLKRFLPFFLTFAAGLFIASFFVNIPRPGFRFNDRASRRFHAFQEMRLENQRLREENDRLREQLGTLQGVDGDAVDSMKSFDGPFPPPPPAPPVRPHIR
jgi:hypothetical protein